MNSISAVPSGDEDHGRTSEEEEGAGEPSCDRQVRSGTIARGRKQESGSLNPQRYRVVMLINRHSKTLLFKWPLQIFLVPYVIENESSMAPLHIQFKASTARGAGDDMRILDFQNQTSQYRGSTLPAATVFGCCSTIWPTFSSFLLSSRQIYIKENNHET